MKGNNLNRSLAGIIIACGLGCGDGRPAMAPVTGRVFVDGEPLKMGVVKFSPENGRQSLGGIREDGSFEMGSYEANDGALIGVHRVAVVACKRLSPTSARWETPKHYADFSTSELTVEVRPSNEPITLELTWGDIKGPFVERDN